MARGKSERGWRVRREERGEEVGGGGVRWRKWGWARVSETVWCSIVERIEGRSVGDGGCEGGGCGRAGRLGNGVVADAVSAAKGAKKGSNGAMEVEYVGEGEWVEVGRDA